MDCNEVKIYYFDALNDVSKLPKPVQTHLEQCDQCQSEITRLGDCLSEDAAGGTNIGISELSLQMRLVNEPAACKQIRCFLPSLLIPQIHPRTATPVTVHLEQCESCREDLLRISDLGYSQKQLLCARRYLAGQDEAGQELGDGLFILHTIREKPSVLSTRMTCSDLSLLNAHEDFVAYTVESTHLLQVAPVKPKHFFIRVLQSSLLRYASAAMFAAALILLATWPSSVQGVDMHEVLSALANTGNIAIKTFNPEGELDREIWIANQQKKYLYIQKAQSTFYNYHNQIRWILDAEGLEKNNLDGHLQFKPLELPWGFFPELKKDIHWEKNQALTQSAKGSIVVYEIIEEYFDHGKMRNYRWRYYLDPYTKLPVKMEYWQKVTGYGNDEFILLDVSEVRYPTDQEFEERVQTAGFQLEYSGDQINREL